MKLILTTDWQLHDNPPHDQIDPGTQQSVRFNETRDTIAKILDAGMAQGADGLLFLGDLTEHKKPTPLESTAAAELFTRVMDRGGFVYALAGNHDGSIFSQSSSSIAPLARMRQDQFKLYHDVKVDLELGMLAIPYIHRASPEQLQALIRKAWLDALLEGTPTPGQKFFGAAHYGVIGATAGPAALPVPGDYLAGEHLLLKANPLDHVFCGHIHQGQQLVVDSTPVYIVGSPTMQNQGERNDKKTWGLFDTVTRQLQVFDVPQPRRFLSLEYSPALAKLPEEAPMPWTDQDIVTLTGEYSKPDYPKDTLEKVFGLGATRPFSLSFETKPKRAARAERSTEISAAGGLRQALQQYLGETYTNTSGNSNLVAPAAELAMTLLEEQGMKVYHPQLDPLALTMKDFLTFQNYSALFTQGKATLITGKNGIGKTNYFEAILWALTGQTSKGLSLAAVVRQNQQEATVVLDLVGHDGAGGFSQRYRITRSVKLAKSGKPKHSLDLVLVNEDGKVKMNVETKMAESLADGGVDETQAKINARMGGTYLTLKTSAFKFQNDTSPFIRTKPSERKAVIGELTGLEPLARAHKILDKRRLESGAAFKSATDRLGGMLAVGADQEQRVAALKTDLEKVQMDLVKQRALVPLAVAELVNAQAKDTAAKAAVQAQQLQLDALPNTAAKVAAADQELRTYKATLSKALQAKRDRFTQLQTEIEQLQAALSALQAPTAEQLKAMEDLLAEAKVELVQLQTKNTGALGALQGAQAAATAAREVTVKAKADASATTLKLAALVDAKAPAPDALAQAQTEVAVADDKIVRLTADISTANAQVSSTNVLLAELKAEAAEHEGKDIGTCSRCKQPIDRAQVEKDLANIKADQERMLKQVIDGQSDADQAKLNLGKAMLAKMTAASRVASLQAETQAAQLAAQQKDQLTALFTQQQATAESAAKDELVKVQAASAAEAEAAAVGGPLAGAVDQVAQFQKKVDDAKALATAVGQKAGQLQAKQDEHKKNTDAGVAEAEETAGITKQLEDALAIAQGADMQNQALAGALRLQLVELQAAAAGTNTWLLTYSNNLNTTKTAVALGEQREKDLQTALKAIDDQKAAVEAAGLELGMLQQRADIDALACSLVDPKVGLPVYLIDQALPFLEDRINLYMQQLGMDRLTVELTTQDGDSETLAVLVDNGRPGPRLDIAAFSGGQLDRVELATKMAMADLARQSRGVTLGLVCYDEPTGGLDEEGKDGLIRQLHDRAGAYPVTLVVSHDETLIRSFDHRLLFSQGPSDETVVAA